ncbi:MAG: hypothetical protein D6766_14220 [Verrucomicrobia bacterium]|nr:MAG: hypothetical protein D6766_14220 [Verrucomicrobiota bacterium]
MRSAGPQTRRDPTPRERAALVALLGDEDPEVFHAVKKRLLECAPESAAWLKEAVLDPDPCVRRHAQEVVRAIARQNADWRFLDFCRRHREEMDLEEGLWLLAATRYPEINIEAYRALLDQFAAELDQRLPRQRRSLACLAVMNDFLFNELRFRGNLEDFHDPDNSYFNRVIDRRTGNPISLCALYWLLARRVGLPVVGVNMPLHFLCRFQTARETVFIDAFNRGKLLTRTDCIRFLQEHGPGFEETALAPATARKTLRRFCLNLQQTYLSRRLTEEAARLGRYLRALDG